MLAASLGVAAISVSGCDAQVTLGKGVDPTSTSTVASRTGARPLATGCEQAAPPGTSAEARAYLAAVNAAYPEWVSITKTMEARGDLLTLDTVIAELRVDREFLRSLKAIHFSAEPEVWAARLRSVLAEYIGDLAAMQKNVTRRRRRRRRA